MSQKMFGQKIHWFFRFHSFTFEETQMATLFTSIDDASRLD